MICQVPCSGRSKYASPKALPRQQRPTYTLLYHGAGYNAVTIGCRGAVASESTVVAAKRQGSRSGIEKDGRGEGWLPKKQPSRANVGLRLISAGSRGGQPNPTCRRSMGEQTGLVDGIVVQVRKVIRLGRVGGWTAKMGVSRWSHSRHCSHFDSNHLA